MDIKDNYVDIGKEIRQLILLEMPAKPICSDECVGICKVCGRHNKKDDFCLCVDENDELIKQRWKTLLNKHTRRK
jgi:uncharacterized protein